MNDSLPKIEIGDLAETATKAEEALLSAGVEIYQYAGALVRPIVEPVTAANGYKTNVARLEPISLPYLRDVLARHAIWLGYQARERKLVRRDPPKEIAQTILGRAGEWKFPIIVGLITTPTMRPDGSLLLNAGFDPATQLLLVDPPPMPTIPQCPTRQDALRALAKLDGLLAEFPLADNIGKAVAFAALITPIARGGYPVAPFIAIDGVAAGAGKSFLCDVAATMATGQLMPVMAAGRSDEEMEKRLGAALMAGQPLISIDNVTMDLGGDALCIAIERGSIRMRVLGLSKNARIEARGTTFFATGNNLVVRGDACRRVITARLDPKVERPELREFKGNPIAQVMADRGAYIAAALTICRAYLVAGRPSPARRLASFEGWSDTVRSALIWLGVADPVAAMDGATALDPERVELMSVMEAWRDAIGERHRRSLAEAAEIASSSPVLLSAFEAITEYAPVNARSLGSWFRRNQDRVLGGYCFRVLSNEKGGSRWWLEPAEGGGQRGSQGGSSDPTHERCQ
jgi:putative DNA primase/helicase